MFKMVIGTSPVLICFGLSFGIFSILSRQNRHYSADWRLAWAASTLVTGVFFTLLPEIASAANSLNQVFLTLAWLLVDAALMAILVWISRRQQVSWLAAAKQEVRDIFQKARTASGSAKLLGGAGVCLVLIVGWVAYTAPTTIWDSHTYHMARIVHWLQNGNLHHYATNISRQLEMPPGAELAAATLMLLNGQDDQLVNLPQWWAFLTSALLASFVACELLKLSERKPDKLDGKKPDKVASMPSLVNFEYVTLLAFILVLTVPEGVTQAISTQTDFLSAMWTIILVAFGLRLLQAPTSLFYLLGVAVSLALGINNKPTIVLYVAPAMLVIGALLLYRRRYMTLFKLGNAMVLAVLVLNAPWMQRNFKTYGGALGPRAIFNLTRPAGALTPAKVFSNVLRNASLYTSTPSEKVTEALNNTIKYLNGFTAESLTNQDWILVGQPFYFQKKANLHLLGPGTLSIGEMGNVFLLVLALAVGMFILKFKPRKILALYLLAVVVGFIFFCGYLRWNPWHSRLHLAYFVLAAPFVAAVLGRVLSAAWVKFWVLLLVVNALLVLFYNYHYPLFAKFAEKPPSREQQYFTSLPDLHDATAELAEDIVAGNITNLFLKIGGDSWEYPLWVCLKNRGFKGKIHHVLVEDESAKWDTADLNLPGSALILHNAELKHPELVTTRFPVQVFYGASWNQNMILRIKGTADETRIKMINNNLVLNYDTPQSGILHILCAPVDPQGNRPTNQMIVASQGRQIAYPIQPELSDFAVPVQPGRIVIAFQMLGVTNTTTLTQFQLKITPASVPSN